jgi:hypothetical protein
MAMCKNKEEGKACKKQATHQCPDCGKLYCEGCASYNDYRCDNHELPALIRIPRRK